ncbi:MAG: flagellar hook-associated protein FlgL [Phycisphaerae bacterium]|nr:flagellar hook-associated protein FlgL [Phycisphaerae bacterium]
MAVIPVNIARVSQNLRSFNMLNTIQANTTSLFKVQNQLSTGLKFSTPSEDPTGAMTVSTIDRQLDRIKQVQSNLNTATTMLAEAESAMASAIDLMREAKNIAVEATNDTISADERESLATVITSTIDEMISIGNSKYLGTYLFSGHQSSQQPFAWDLDGVAFYGDEGRRETIVDSDFSQDVYTISGQTFFGAISTPISGTVDLAPAVTESTRICDLRGPSGEIPDLGRVRIGVGDESFDIDLSGADTVGDVLDMLSTRLPESVEVALNNNALQLSGAGLTVDDIGGGLTAQSLGILARGDGVGSVIGFDLNPTVTPRTTIDSLQNGAGLDLDGGIVIRNGSHSATIDLSDAETIEDVINRINNAGVGAWAQVSNDGRHIDVLNRVSGTSLVVEENGGSAATNLGIRTIAGDTPLSDLNLGLGVGTVDGDDIRITTGDGGVLTFDLDGAQTLQDVLDLLNESGAITAALSDGGNGIVITDNTGGPDALSIEAVNMSPAVMDLGLNVTTDGATLVGDEINPVKVESTFTALLELRDGLLSNDTTKLTFAGERLERVLENMEAVRGELAAEAKSMDDRATRIEAEAYSAEVLRSDIQDVDMTDAVVRYQQLETALQANLVVSARMMNLTLLAYLD